LSKEFLCFNGNVCKNSLTCAATGLAGVNQSFSYVPNSASVSVSLLSVFMLVSFLFL
jgi:hypothetical protein